MTKGHLFCNVTSPYSNRRLPTSGSPSGLYGWLVRRELAKRKCGLTFHLASCFVPYNEGIGHPCRCQFCRARSIWDCTVDFASLSSDFLFRTFGQRHQHRLIQRPNHHYLVLEQGFPLGRGNIISTLQVEVLDNLAGSHAGVLSSDDPEATIHNVFWKPRLQRRYRLSNSPRLQRLEGPQWGLAA